jgi:hypothetical protein
MTLSMHGTAWWSAAGHGLARICKARFLFPNSAEPGRGFYKGGMAMESKLGELCSEHCQRDAVHVAYLPVWAHKVLYPGQKVGVDGGYSADGKPVGIVDPFLESRIEPGQRFKLCLFPGSVTGMRHHWECPAVAAETPNDKAISGAWLRNYAAAHNTYDEPEEAFQRLCEGLRSGELFFSGSDLHSFSELDQADELKRHAENFLGVKINWDDFGFSCSC